MRVLELTDDDFETIKNALFFTKTLKEKEINNKLNDEYHSWTLEQIEKIFFEKNQCKELYNRISQSSL